MPLCYVNGEKFMQIWDREWDIILLIVAHNYRSPKGHIRWKEARADGYLVSLPGYLSNKDLSRRLSHLLNNKYDIEWKKKKNQRNYGKYAQGNPKAYNRRYDLFRALPEETKKKYGYKTKQIWSTEQQELLIGMAEEYRISEKKIDWRSLVKDKRVKHFPHQNLQRLRSYYWRVITLATNPRALEKKRASSRRWKAEHMDRYNENQKRRRHIIRTAANDIINPK